MRTSFKGILYDPLYCLNCLSNNRTVGKPWWYQNGWSLPGECVLPEGKKTGYLTYQVIVMTFCVRRNGLGKDDRKEPFGCIGVGDGVVLADGKVPCNRVYKIYILPSHGDNILYPSQCRNGFGDADRRNTLAVSGCVVPTEGNGPCQRQ